MRFAILGITCLVFAQDFSEIQVERAATVAGFAASPVWSKANAALLFCDVPNNRIFAYQQGKGLGKFREEMGGASGLAYDHEGRLIVAQSRSRRIVRVYPGDQKKLDVLAEKFEGKRFNGPSDIVVRKDGHIYFTDPAFGYQNDTRELDFHGVFHLTPRGDLTVIAKPKGRPNGIALAPGGKLLYVSSSDERRIYAYDLDGKGAASNERVFLSGIDGPPAGLTTDEKGNLYIAANGVLIVSPSAQTLYNFPLGSRPGNLAFGDEDLMTLYISAKNALYRARMKVKGAVSE